MNALRKARERAGFSQSQLARAVEVPQATISAIERGVTKQPGHDLVIRICRALNCDPDDVFPVPTEQSA